MTVYTCHQPDLLPYSGFWFKMAHADIFDLKIWDQFVERGYQRRVKMRDRWISLPLVRGSNFAPINTRLIKPEAVSFLADQIHKRYAPSTRTPRYWRQRHDQILDSVLSIKTDLLWDLNLQLILLVRDMLDIDTAITLSRPVPSHLRGGEGIVATMQGFNTPMTYLSGNGARAYMGDCAEFHAAGIPVVWSTHHAVTGDSVLSVIFDYEDPLSVVLASEPDESVSTLEGASA